MVEDYIGKMKVFGEWIELTKEDSYVRIPNKEILTREMVKESLLTTSLTIEDFEEYLEYTEAMKSFTQIIDSAIK